jgi:hypothetical protein
LIEPSVDSIQNYRQSFSIATDDRNINPQVAANNQQLRTRAAISQIALMIDQ